MYTIRNAAPRAILRGIKDESGHPPVYEPDFIPTHLPHVFLFTQKGPTIPQLTVGNRMIEMYGLKSFEYRTKYTTHQTVLANVVKAEGNYLMVQRVVPPGANPPAGLRLCIDWMPEELPIYERAVDGKYKLDENGDRIETGETIEGYVFRWFIMPLLDEDDDGRYLEDNSPRLLENGEARIINTTLGTGVASNGYMTNSAGEQSTVYPIMDLEAMDFGDYGNNLGFRLYAPTSETELEADVTTIEEQNAYLYRMTFVEKDEATQTPRILENLWGEKFVEFSFKEGVVNNRINKELFIDYAVLPTFEQEAVGGFEEIRAPFGKLHIYHTFFQDILSKLHEKEAVLGTVPDGDDYIHLVNPFTGHDYHNIPYSSVKILGPADNGILLTSNSSYYCNGGYDGIMTPETFDLAVRYQLQNYGNLDAKVLDSAVYPQSVLYDSGFTLETKKAFFKPIGVRKDIWVVVATQDVSKRQNTPSEESSMAIALKTAARMYPESEIYGTATCRAIVHGQSGYLMDSPYKGLLPLTIEFAQKCAKYMGSGTGVWNAGRAFDMPFNNHVKLFKGVNAEWLSPNVRSRDWDNGLVWVQNYDRRSLFWPGIQTVYDDDTSVLNAAANMMIAVELEKVAERTWRDLTGISYLSPERFIELSDRIIKQRVEGRFDSRVIIRPETFFTQNDEQRGYSWSCNIHMYAPNMKTVGTFTIVAHRITDA